MNRDADKNLIDLTWVARCARRLRGRWPHADPTSLEEAAAELWAEPRWRELAPVDAAERWLESGRRDARASDVEGEGEGERQGRGQRRA